MVYWVAILWLVVVLMPIAKVFHEACGCIADMQWNRILSAETHAMLLVHGREDSLPRAVAARRFGRLREHDDTVRQVYAALG